MKLLTTSTKIEKSNNAGLGYLSTIMYLSPHNSSGKNVCPNASPGCISSCLNTAGRGRMNSVQEARLKRTKLFFEDRKTFKKKLVGEISAFSRKAAKLDLKPAIRLNGTADINLELLMPDIFPSFPQIQFYDYTKNKLRMIRYLNGELPPNYFLTFSRSELNEKDCQLILKLGGTVAAVFEKVPQKYLGFKVIDGDKHDLIFTHKGPCILGLKMKGLAKKDDTGFVIRKIS